MTYCSVEYLLLHIFPSTVGIALFLFFTESLRKILERIKIGFASEDN